VSFEKNNKNLFPRYKNTTLGYTDNIAVDGDIRERIAQQLLRKTQKPYKIVVPLEITVTRRSRSMRTYGQRTDTKKRRKFLRNYVTKYIAIHQMSLQK